MVLITFLKPNLVIHSDILISGKIDVLDKQKHLLMSINVVDKSFVSIKAKPEWPKEIEIKLRTGNVTFNKELLI